MKLTNDFLFILISVLIFGTFILLIIWQWAGEVTQNIPISTFFK
jgi:nitrogen fixation-related uncharacterized protein